MSYELGEAAALTLIQALDGWSSDNSVSIANDSTNRALAMVNSGKDYEYCFLEPADFSSMSSRIGVSRDETRWRTTITLVCFANPKTGQSAARVLAVQREAIKRKLDP